MKKLIIFLTLFFIPLLVYSADTEITDTNVTTNELNESRYHPINWDESFGWGDHSLAGYLANYMIPNDIFNMSRIPTWVNFTNISVENIIGGLWYNDSGVVTSRGDTNVEGLGSFYTLSVNSPTDEESAFYDKVRILEPNEFMAVGIDDNQAEVRFEWGEGNYKILFNTAGDPYLQIDSDGNKVVFNGISTLSDSVNEVSIADIRTHLDSSSITHEDYLNKTDMPVQVNTTEVLSEKVNITNGDRTGSLVIGDVNISVDSGVIKFTNMNSSGGGESYQVGGHSWLSIDLRESNQYHSTFNLDTISGDNDNIQFMDNLLMGLDDSFSFGSYPQPSFKQSSKWNNTDSHDNRYPFKLMLGTAKGPAGYSGRPSGRAYSGVFMLEEYNDQRVLYNWYDNPTLMMCSSDNVNRTGVNQECGTIQHNQSTMLFDNHYGNFTFNKTLEVTNGDIIGNFIYGELWNHTHTAVPLTFATQEVYYNVSIFEYSRLNGFTTDGENLTALVAGLYDVNYDITGSGQNNHEYVTTITINGEEQNNTAVHKKMSAGGDITPMNGGGFIQLAVGDEVRLAVQDYSGIGAGNLYSVEMRLSRIGN